MKNKNINIITGAIVIIVIIFVLYILYKLFNKLREGFQTGGSFCGAGGLPNSAIDPFGGTNFTNCLKLYYAVNDSCNVDGYTGAIYNPTRRFITTNQNRPICIGTKSERPGASLYYRANSNTGICNANQGEVQMDMADNSGIIRGSMCFRLQYTTNNICNVTSSAGMAGFRSIRNPENSEVKDIGTLNRQTGNRTYKSICITDRAISSS
jgi:hypothetical protein